MPKSLPTDALKVWEQVYEASKSAGDDESTAAQRAWGAVKRSWEKNSEGKWVKKALAEFSLTIKKASFDQTTQEMRWRADTSDTEEDLYQDNMSLELYEDFLCRIESKEPLPDGLGSDFWNGGTPYLSVSHYSDMNGDAVPGTVDCVYVDGRYLKAKGRFSDTPLGRACFKSLVDDLAQYRATSENHDGRVRVSISFLDWKHRHKGSEFVFERKSLEDVCPECLAELISGKSKGKTYLRGHLIHLALTRVPVNTRALMEVDKSMTTRKEDAASIVGEELADELEQKAQSVKNMAIVEMSDAAEPESVVHRMEMEDKEDEEEADAEGMSEKKKKGEKKEEYASKADIAEIRSALAEISRSVQVQPHHLDHLWHTFRSAYDNTASLDMSAEDKLKTMQVAFDELAQGVIRSVKPDVVESKSDASVAADGLVEALSQVLQPLSQKLDLLTTQLSQADRPKPAVPAPRSIPAAAVQKSVVEPVIKSETPKLRALLERNYDSAQRQ